MQTKPFNCDQQAQEQRNPVRTSGDRYAGVFWEPKRLLLDMAQERSLPDLLQLIVQRLAESQFVALARLWLIDVGDRCGTCRLRSDCPDQSQCLHLRASAGRPVADAQADWGRLDGQFSRLPLGTRKIGQIALTGEPVEAPNLESLPPWLLDPAWAQREQIVAFGGQPLIHHDQILGVLAVFTRAPMEAGCLDWLRMFANHAAAAIINARTFAELESLKQRLQQENEYLRAEVAGHHQESGMVGSGPALQALQQQIDLVARTEATVLILGESGTGKEVVAREIHRRSGRAEQPMIKVNCAAVPRELFESEFFGHAKGSFTGALRDRAGRFELAHGGTLFLDEVGEIPIELQSKLLRVIQEGELERVGEERTRTVDVRIIAATNRNLWQEVQAGQFRSDLYFRLSVFPIEVLALRHRLEDVPALADHFLHQLARRLGKPKPELTLKLIQQLQQYAWPGNIRELQHVLERAMIRSQAGQLELDFSTPGHLQPIAISPATSVSESTHKPASNLNPETRGHFQALPVVRTEAEMRQLELDNLRAALTITNGKLYGPTGAAALLGIKPTTLASRLKKFGLQN